MDVGTGYRPLEIGEVHAVGDEWFRDGVWYDIASKFVGLTYYGISYPFRRKVPVERPKEEWEKALPAGHRMATEADRGTPIGRDWKAWVSEWEPIRPNVVGKPLEPWTGNGSSHVPMCMPIPSVVPGISEEEATGNISRAMQEDAKAMGEMASTIPQESQDRKETGYTVEEVRESQKSSTPTEDDLLRFTGMPKTITPDHPWWPRPFTPNKYTRYIPTLDGRKVPVDVYCVLAAFPTGASAVDHAVKKLLAPGQRGHKDRIQDLKEARDSLNRAIELEETVDG